MQTLKAVIQYIDSIGRVVLITETNEAILVYTPAINGYRKGDEVTVNHVYEKERRQNPEWQIVPEGR